jgi:hypothetical protein
VPKCSVLPDAFNIDINWLNAAGIPLRLFSYFLGFKTSANAARTAQFQTKTGDDPLNIRQLLLIFIILIGGLMMAILAFAHEIYTARKNSSGGGLVTEVNRVLRVDKFSRRHIKVALGDVT